MTRLMHTSNGITHSPVLTDQQWLTLQQFVLQTLPDTPRLADAAQVLHISSRTLQRLLQNNASSFRLVVSQCRHQLAQQYLQTNDLSLQQIASKLGFEEQSSFQKAFKCWQGCTPGKFRQYKQQPALSFVSTHQAGQQVNYGTN